MFRLKKAIVIALEKACGLLDQVPVPYRHEGRLHLGGGALGCYWFRLAARSAQLDERWGTGVWETPEQ